MALYDLNANMRLKAIFVQNLRKYRNHRGITQAKLAELCNKDTSYIGQIEIGARFPSMELIEKIAEALQIKPHLFFLDDAEEGMAQIPPLVNANGIPDSVKDELIKRLNAAVTKVVRKTG